jgi:polyisoprenoid-binding protein YceI
MRRWILAASLVAVMAVSALAATSTWQIDPNHANAQFTVRHLAISNVQGEFTKISGTVDLDENDITKSVVNATIDTTSLDTRVTMRDNDLKSEKFFNVAKFPTMTFKSTKIEKTGDGTAKMTGDLTIRDVTKSVTFDVTGPTPAIKAMGGMRRGVSATTKINRQDFGLTADPSPMIGDEVTITLDIEMAQK